VVKTGKAKWKHSPPAGSKDVKIKASPESTDKQTPAWQFHKGDREHAEWGWDKLSHQQFFSVVHEQLAQFETMTWAEIFQAVGDKDSGNKHHNVSVENCCKDAQKRLEELKADDLDEIFSLRLSNKYRLWGVKDGRVLRFIWDDQNHTVCPKKK
jgi:hypothetical protein